MDNLHPTMRGWFAFYLLQKAKKDGTIIVVTADLGYGMWDEFKKELPNQFYNVGASEQAAAGICVGLAMEGKKPFFYSITPFGLFRPFETWRNYVDHEKIPVRLCFSGRNDDYKHDGFSHYAGDDMKVITSCFPNIMINSFWPETKEDVPELVERLVSKNVPAYLNLRR